MADNGRAGKKTAAAVAAALCAAFALGAAGVSVVRELSERCFLLEQESSRHAADTTTKLQWLAAVEKGDREKALLLAEKIVPSVRPEPPPGEFVRLVMLKKISTTFLTDGFCGFDFQRWRDALELRRLARSIVSDRTRAAAEIFKAVSERFKEGATDAPGVSPPSSDMEAWNGGKGGETEKIRLFCALCEQAGLDVKIVVFENKDGIQTASVCEASNPATGRRDLAAFSEGVLLEGVSAKDLAAGSTGRDLPGRLAKAAGTDVCFIQPSAAADFRAVNERLRDALAKDGDTGQWPVFGRNPKKLTDVFCEEMDGLSNRKARAYWDLQFEAAMSSPEFKKSWLADKAGTPPKGSEPEKK